MNDLIKDCVGCGLCVMECPKHAISMHSNEEGFLYPEIDEQICDGCDICNLVCKGYKEQCHQKNKAPKVKVN